MSELHDMQRAGHVPLAVVTRAGRTESVHYGSIAVVDTAGRVVSRCGEPASVCYARSACKPFQALALLSHPDVGRFDFSLREIAIICASHSGEPRHVETVLGILEKIGCRRSDLRCGVHVPLYYEAVEQRPAAEDVFTPLHHNCSGKHAGMLALARLCDAPIESYLEPEHPVQQRILQAVAHFSGVPAAQIPIGIDGCSVPTFALPLAALARAFAHLVRPQPDAVYGEAPATIVEAMTTHPEMVSGLKRIDLALMHAGHGEWVTKIGAEGVHGLGLRSRGLGVAIKIADGASRALPAVSIEVLSQLGLLDEAVDTPLEDFAHPRLHNSRGIEVGDIRPVLRLE